jgi:hypothetical protein
MKLVEVELSEGLVEIGDDSFRWCENSITKINIPHSGRLTNVHSCPLFDVPFVSTMALKELEEVQQPAANTTFQKSSVFKHPSLNVDLPKVRSPYPVKPRHLEWMHMYPTEIIHKLVFVHETTYL